MTLTSWIRTVMLRELEALERELELFGSDELVWATAPGISNSCGTLTFHLAGNLQHYFGGAWGRSCSNVLLTRGACRRLAL
jgi:hypothetical protein